MKGKAVCQSQSSSTGLYPFCPAACPRARGQAAGQKGYQPVLEDWLWHTAFPFIPYVTLLAASITLRQDPTRSLLVIAATALVLLFDGIHNAWDAVTYIATQQPRHAEGPPGEK